MSELSILKDKIEKVRLNPAAMQRLMLDELEKATNGEGRVPDPTNPFVFLMESAVTHSSVAIQAAETLTRKQYPSVAQTQEDLYRHMSDKDYIDRFASPSRTSFILLIGIDEFYQKAIPVPGSNMRKLVIPRHSEFQVAGYKFTMQYPIELRVMAHGGTQIVYDVTKPSPLQSLETNVVSWKAINLNDVDYIRLDIPVQQVEITTHYAKLNNASGFTQSYALTDQYYYCRVYSSTVTGEWEEIRTTHTDQVFDQTVPTVVLRVEKDALHVHVPPIYFTTGLMDKELRVDIYTTKGPLDLNLINYEINSFLANWRDIEGDDNGVFSAPLASFNSLSVFSTSIVTGGSNALSFEALRERVLNSNLGSVDIPITDVHLSTHLEDRGYRLVKNVDNITNRIYQATRAIPQPTTQITVSGIGARIGTIQRSMDSLKMLDTVSDNGNRITLLPSTLYVEVDGIISPADNGLLSYVNSLGNEALASNVNNNNYLYTPFHYVLDINDNIFDLRPYYLDSPTIESRVFVEENDSTLLEIATGSYAIKRHVDGYEITVVTQSGKSYRDLPDDQLHVHLSYVPIGENNRAFLKGELVGTDEDTGERVFRFFIGTNNDVNANDHILLTSFKLLDAETERNFAAQLLTTFDVVYAVSNYSVPGLEVSGLDRYIAPYLLPDTVESFVGVVHEKLSVSLGYALNGLWSKSRTVVSSFDYELYEADVPMTYEKNVYELDPLSGGIKIYDNNGVLSYNKLHSMGDPVLDELGHPVLKFLKGDIKRDNSGNPIIKNPRSLLRHLELFLLDGKYYFANDASTVQYRDTIPMSIVDWLRNDIVPLSQRMLENTELFYYPQATLGNIDVTIDGGDRVNIPAEQSFTCQVYVTRAGYINNELRASITNTIVRTIAEELQDATVSMKDIITKITTILGDDVLGLRISGLGGSFDVNTLTMLDDSQRPVIRKYLSVDTDGKLSVRDDIAIDFTRHLTE